MSISILNRGASGGLKPELTATAPSGSTIDLIQNGIIVATYTLSVNETEHTFVVKVGTYTVRGTLGEQTKSVEVVVDAVGQYAVVIAYILYLYNEGDECTDVTGGWSAGGYTFESSGVGYYSLTEGTKNTDNLYVKSSGASSSINLLGTGNAIDLTGYTKLFVDADHGGNSGTPIRLSTSKAMVAPDTLVDFDMDTSGRTTYEFSLENQGIDEPRFVIVSAQNTSGRTLKVYQIRLE